MSLRHSGHARVWVSMGGSVLRRRISALTGFTTRKKRTATMTTNAISALMNDPYRKWLLLIVKERDEKSGLPPIAAMSGVTRSAMNAVTTATNARAMTKPTAVSTRLPRSRNSLKSFIENLLRSRTRPRGTAHTLDGLGPSPQVFDVDAPIHSFLR